MVFALYASAVVNTFDNLNGSLDARFAVFRPKFQIDADAGIVLNIANVTNSESSLYDPASFQMLSFRAGLSSIFGDRAGTNCFLQLGVTDVALARSSVRPEKKFSFDNLFFVIEPRLHFEAPQAEFPFSCNFTLYWMPKSEKNRYLYIDNPLGVSASVFFTALTASGLESDVFLTMSVPEDELTVPDYTMTAVVKLRIVNGIFHVGSRVILNKLLKGAPNSFEINLGYRLEL